jgi:hypothetical protein
MRTHLNKITKEKGPGTIVYMVPASTRLLSSNRNNSKKKKKKLHMEVHSSI